MRGPARPAPCRPRGSRRPDRRSRRRAGPLRGGRMRRLAADLGIAAARHAAICRPPARRGDRRRRPSPLGLARRPLGRAAPRRLLGAQGRRARRGAGAADLRHGPLSASSALGAGDRAARRSLAAARRSGCSACSARVAAALLVRSVARGLSLPRWIAWLLAAFLFAAMLADAVGGLEPSRDALDRLAFTLGSRRLSAARLVQIADRPARALRGRAARQPARRRSRSGAPAASIRPSSCSPRSSPRSRSSSSPSSSASTSPASTSPRWRSSRARSASPSASACRRRSAI